MPKDGIGAQQVNWVRGVVAPGARVGRKEHSYPTVRPSQLAVPPVTFWTIEIPCLYHSMSLTT
jgi:hypothetical protein